MMDINIKIAFFISKCYAKIHILERTKSLIYINLDGIMSNYKLVFVVKTKEMLSFCTIFVYNNLMRKNLLLILYLCCCVTKIYSQNILSNDVNLDTDSVAAVIDTIVYTNQVELDKNQPDRFPNFKRYPPKFDSLENRFSLRNETAPFGRKLMRSSLLMLGYNAGMTSLLLILPEEVSKWNKKNYRNQIRRAYTEPPHFDKDKWYINYLGHPYQGTIYYNSMRSQGATWWQSALFGIGSIALWEYTVEAGFEQPSIQDLIVTPIAGALIGELFHFSTIRMSKNGYKWYEKTFVSLLNPSFAINNGFKWAETNELKYKF